METQNSIQMYIDLVPFIIKKMNTNHYIWISRIHSYVIIHRRIKEKRRNRTCNKNIGKHFHQACANNVGSYRIVEGSTKHISLAINVFLLHLAAEVTVADFNNFASMCCLVLCINVVCFIISCRYSCVLQHFLWTKFYQYWAEKF